MTAPPPVLGGGLWLHVVLEFGNCDGARLGAEAHAIGARGLIIHSIGTATPSLRWIERETPRLGRPFQLAVGIGSRGPRKWKDHFAQPVVDTLKAGFRAVPDWEKAWSGPEGRPAGARVATYVLDFVQDAVGFVADNPWWAPLYFLREQKGKTRKVNTHPNAPTREFGRLCATRYVQAYPLVMDGLPPALAASVWRLVPPE